jgi:hypothetical protein
MLAPAFAAHVGRCVSRQDHLQCYGPTGQSMDWSEHVSGGHFSGDPRSLSRGPSGAVGLSGQFGHGHRLGATSGRHQPVLITGAVTDEQRRGEMCRRDPTAVSRRRPRHASGAKDQADRHRWMRRHRTASPNPQPHPRSREANARVLLSAHHGPDSHAVSNRRSTYREPGLDGHTLGAKSRRDWPPKRCGVGHRPMCRGQLPSPGRDPPDR